MIELGSHRAAELVRDTRSNRQSALNFVDAFTCAH